MYMYVILTESEDHRKCFNRQLSTSFAILRYENNWQYGRSISARSTLSHAWSSLMRKRCISIFSHKLSLNSHFFDAYRR
jgi:hypothetical protein